MGLLPVFEAGGGLRIVSPGALAPWLNTTRAAGGGTTWSGGAPVSAAVDTPRFDQASRLLVEEARTNLALDSNALNSANWNNGGLASSVSGGGFLLTEAATNAEHELFNGGVATTAAVVYTVYADLQAGTRTQAFVSFAIAGGRLGAFFDLSAGTVGAVDGGVTAAIVDLGGGVYRCIIILTAATTATRFISIFSAAGGSRTTSGSGTVVGYRAQCEAAGFSTSFIISAGVAGARAVDQIQGTLPGWFSAAAGTVIARAMLPQNAGGTPQGVIGFSDGTNNNRIVMRNGSAAVMNALTVAGGVTQVNVATGNSYTAGSAFKAAIAWDSAGACVCMNGGTVVTGTGTLPTGLTTAWIGQAAASSAQPMNGALEWLEYYPVRLANAALQGLTT